MDSPTAPAAVWILGSLVVLALPVGLAACQPAQSSPSPVPAQAPPSVHYPADPAPRPQLAAFPDVVPRACRAWAVSPRVLARALEATDPLERARRLDMLARAAALSGRPARDLAGALVRSSADLKAHGLPYGHRLALVSALAVSEPEPRRVAGLAVRAVDALASSPRLAARPDVPLVDRLVQVGHWCATRQSDHAQACLDTLVPDPQDRHALLALVQPHSMAVACGLLGELACATGWARTSLEHYPPAPDEPVEQPEAWRTEHVIGWGAHWLSR